MDRSEQLIVESLSKHAVDAPADERLLAGVHARLRRRRTGRMIGAAVVAAAAAATAITAAQSLTLRPAQVAQEPAAGWRWESFKTVEVQVPSSWTQYVSGAAPCPSTPGSPVIGRFNDWLGGRRQLCTLAVLPLKQRQDYVWFNDVQEPGIKRYDGGWTEETRLVAGVKVSVLARDDQLRRRILDSARPVDGADHYGCRPRDPGDQPGQLGTDEVTAVDVCEYFNGSLVAGSAMTPTQVAAYASRLGTVTTNTLIPAIRCPEAPHLFVITVHTRSTAWTRRVSVSPCAKAGHDDVLRQGPHQQAQPLSYPAGSATSPSTR